MTAPSVVVFGRNGQVARGLAEAWGSRAHLFGRTECDVFNESAIAKVLEQTQAAAVVNASAYTEVDKAEVETEQARALNAVAPGNMARACARKGIPFVHISTDYVFDGTKPGGWTETDVPSPLGAYGATKREGEEAVAAAGGTPFVLRTSWVYGTEGKNFFLTMLRLARTHPVLRVVADQHGSPTSSHALSCTIARLVDTLLAGGPAFQQHTAGLYHLASQGETTWHGFAERIVAGLKEREHIPCTKVQAITTAEFPTAAKRPAHSRLDSSLFRRTFLFGIEDWESGLADVWKRYDAAAQGAK
ncbi:MAG: dTDP-4-dehydrorhamnose reductase [Silvanigrellales bacterium]|nr:dTDP-4-dehydrorhamnose reductase [Silvanigrellales bacterium]